MILKVFLEQKKLIDEFLEKLLIECLEEHRCINSTHRTVQLSDKT